MTNRERAMNILHYQPADRFPAVHFGYWSELLEEWAGQGKISKELAESVADGNEADKELDRIIGWDFDWCRTASSPPLSTRCWRPCRTAPSGSRTNWA